MNVLEKLRNTIAQVIGSKDVAKSLEDLGYSRERAKALATTRGIESARSLNDKPDK